jgi:hypothetical protein
MQSGRAVRQSDWSKGDARCLGDPRVECIISKRETGDDAFGRAAFEERESSGRDGAAVQSQAAPAREPSQDLVRQPSDADLQRHTIVNKRGSIVGDAGGFVRPVGPELGKLALFVIDGVKPINAHAYAIPAGRKTGIDLR